MKIRKIRRILPKVEVEKLVIREATLDHTDTLAPYLMRNLPYWLDGCKVMDWGPYAVSSDGRVYNLNSYKKDAAKRWLKAVEGSGGFLKYRLQGYSGEYRWFAAHRLVAMLWVRGRTKNRSEVRHKDGNKKNNHYKNLVWVTRSENLKRGRKRVSPDTRQKMSEAKKGENHPRFKGWYIEGGRRYASVGELARKMGTYPTAVYRMVEKGLVGFEPVDE